MLSRWEDSNRIKPSNLLGRCKSRGSSDFAGVIDSSIAALLAGPRLTPIDTLDRTSLRHETKLELPLGRLSIRNRQRNLCRRRIASGLSITVPPA